MPGGLLIAYQGSIPKIYAQKHVCGEGTPTGRALEALGPKPQNFPDQSGTKNLNIFEVDFRVTSGTGNLSPQDAAPLTL